MKSRSLRLMAVILAGTFVIACKNPDVQISPRPIDHIEISMKIDGISVATESAMCEQFSKDVQLPVTPVHKKRSMLSWFPLYGLVHGPHVTCKFESQESIRVLQLNVRGRKSIYSNAGLPKTLLLNTGSGMAIGGLLGGGAGYSFTSWPAVAIGSGVGGVIGIVTGPTTFHAHEETRNRLGYLPWKFSCSWLLLARNKDLSEKPLASGRILAAKPLLRPLLNPPPTDEAIQEENIRAYSEALENELKLCLESLTQGNIPKHLSP